MDFVEVVQEKPLLPLSKDDIRTLLEHTEDESLWLEMLPPDRFSLKGFVQGTLHDVTQIQIHTKMRALISEVGSVTDPLKFLDLVTRNFQNSTIPSSPSLS